MTPRTEQWADAYRAGATIAAIARTHRVASSVVQRALSRAGVPMRGHGPPRREAPPRAVRGVGRPSGAHSQAVRVLRLVALLATPHTLVALARTLKVTPRTVRRDLVAVGEVYEVCREGERFELGKRR